MNYEQFLKENRKCKTCRTKKVDLFGNYDCPIPIFGISENSVCEEHIYEDEELEKAENKLLEEESESF